jgi:hypothetical protein
VNRNEVYFSKTNAENIVFPLNAETKVISSTLVQLYIKTQLRALVSFHFRIGVSDWLFARLP